MGVSWWDDAVFPFLVLVVPWLLIAAMVLGLWLMFHRRDDRLLCGGIMIGEMVMVSTVVHIVHTHIFDDVVMMFMGNKPVVLGVVPDGIFMGLVFFIMTGCVIAVFMAVIGVILLYVLN
jgi:hypothetical protein